MRLPGRRSVDAVKDGSNIYASSNPQLNEWGLSGDWTIGEELARLNQDGSIVYRFHARDLHLVLGAANGKPIRFQIAIDGKPPGDSHGADVNADPGLEAYAFTFG